MSFAILSKWLSRPAACSRVAIGAVKERLPWSNDGSFSWLQQIGVSRPSLTPPQTQQVRWITKATKIRNAKRRLWKAMKAKGIAPPGPQKFINKNTPVINAVSRADQQAIAKRQDEESAEKLEAKIQESSRLMLTHHMSQTSPTFSLTISPRVQKVFALALGNQRQVVQAQKHRGMELFQLREGDTGSSAVQVVAITTRIQQLQVHLNDHKKDYSCKRGLNALYVRRRKLLDYMERREKDDYRKVVKTLGLFRK